MTEETYWIHLDKENPAYEGVESAVEAKFVERRPDNILSYNNKADNKETVMKLVAETGWYESSEANIIRNSPSLIRTYFKSEHRLAWDLVHTVAWLT